MVITIIVIVILSVSLVGSLVLNHPPENTNTNTPTASPSPSVTVSNSPNPTQNLPTVTPTVSTLEQPNIITTSKSYSTVLSSTPDDTHATFWPNFNLTNTGTSPAYKITLHITANDTDNVPVISSDLIVAEKIMPNESLSYFGAIDYYRLDVPAREINTSSVLFAIHYSAQPVATAISETVNIEPVTVGSKITVTLQNIGNTNVTIVDYIRRDAAGNSLSQSVALIPRVLAVNGSPYSYNLNRPITPGNYTYTFITQTGNSFTTNPINIP